MAEYLKAIVPFVGGVVLLIVGALIDEEVLLYVGGSLVGVAPVVAYVPNRPKPKKRVRKPREAGYGLVEVLIAAILLIVFIWLVFRIA